MNPTNKILPESFNIIDDIVIVINENYEIEELNQKGKEVFNISSLNKANNKCFNLICRQTEPQKNCPIYCLKNSTEGNSEYLINKNNRHYRIKAVEFVQDNGEVKYLDFLTDFTELVNSEKRQKEITEEYHALNEEYQASAEELAEKNKLVNEEREKFELLFTNMNSAFALHEIILDEKGVPCDYRFIECNSMFEKLTGLKAKDIIGKTVLEVLPGTEKCWIETYGRVALSGEQHNYTNYAKELDKYYETRSYCPQKGFFAVTFYDVTKRKKAEENLSSKNKEYEVVNKELEESIERTQELNTRLEETLERVEAKEHVLRTIYNNAPSIMMLLDENTEIISMNTVGLKMADKTDKEVVGLRGGDVLNCVGTINNPKGCGFGELCDNCKTRQTIEHTINTGEAQVKKEAKLSIKSVKDNKTITIHILVSSTIINIEGSRQVLVTIEDITELHKQKTAIQESEEKYKALYYNAPLSYQSLDAEGRIIDVNPHWLTTLGYKREEVVGKVFSDFIHSEMVPVFKERFPKFKKEGASHNVHFKLRKKDDSYIDASFEGRIGYTPEGNFKQTYCTFKDISKEVEVENAKNKLLKSLQTIFLVTPTVIGHIKGRIILEINERVNDLLGYKPDELIGKSARVLYANDDDFNYVGVEKYRQIKQNGIGEVESRFQHKNGAIIDVLISSAPIDDNDIAKGTIFTALDISEIKKSNRILIEKIEEYEALNEELNQTNEELYQVKESLKVKLDTILNPKIKTDKLRLTEFIDLELLQSIQDVFAKATGVASVITDTKGQPITSASNFSDLCSLIRKTDKGKLNCHNSDKTIGKLAYDSKEIVIQPCLGCGLYDAGTPIIIGEKAIAYWLIGQVRTPDIKANRIARYANEINADKKEMIEAFNKLDTKDLEGFKKLTNLLEIISQEISQLAYNNIQLAKNNELIKQHEQSLKKERDNAIKSEFLISKQNQELEWHNERLESLLRISKHQTTSKQELLDYALAEAIKLTQSKIGYIYFYNEETQQFKLNTWSKEVMKECKVMRPDTVYNLETTGCWGEVVRQGKPIIINDYAAPHKHKKGTPEGHVQMKKFMSIPVIINNKIIAVVGVANKQSNYIQTDVKQLTLLMDSVWNILERIDLIANLKTEKQNAEKANRLKTVFLANMSHEIRTPLNGIMGFTDIMASKKNMSEKQRSEYAKIIQQSGNNLLQIVNDILDISAIENDSLFIVKKTFEINEVLWRLFNIYNKKIKNENSAIKLNFKRALGNVVVNSDETRLVQIVTNLLDNAFKFTHEGAVEFGIYQITTKEITLFVKDTGIGISKEQQKVIFDRFRQAEISSNRLYGGNGLGLAIVKELLQLLGGKIWLESEAEKGSVFYFTLPYEANYNKELGTDEIIIKNTPEQIIKNELKILVVEDEQINRFYLKEILSSIDASITFVENGKDGINKARETLYDLILMDIRLPDINGFEATKEIRKFNPKVPIIAQTAYAMDSDEKEAYSSGCTDYIAKPLKQEVLLEKIHNLKK